MIVGLAEVSGQQGAYQTLLQRNEALYDTFHAAFCVSGHNVDCSLLVNRQRIQNIELWSGTFREWADTLVINMRKDSNDLQFWNMFYHLFQQTGLGFLWSRHQFGTVNNYTYFI
jgi:hypothetical protein